MCFDFGGPSRKNHSLLENIVLSNSSLELGIRCTRLDCEIATTKTKVTNYGPIKYVTRDQALITRMSDKTTTTVRPEASSGA